MAPAGQLWSTAGDLCRFGAFLAGGDDLVLSAASLREALTPSTPPESGDWSGGYGLGFQLVHGGGRTLVGHTGSLPGFIAALWVSAEDGLVAVTLANATSGPFVGVVAAELIGIVADAEPRIPQPWRPLPEIDQELLALTGPWYWGATPFALRLTADGGLDFQPLRAGAAAPGSRRGPTAPGRGSTATTRGDAEGRPAPGRRGEPSRSGLLRLHPCAVRAGGRGPGRGGRAGLARSVTRRGR